MSSAICFSLDQSKILLLGNGLTLSQQALVFTCLQYKPFEDTVEKEKLLVLSNFSLSHSIVYPLGELSAIFIKFEIVVCKLFQCQRV